MRTLSEQLPAILHGRVCIVGVGSDLRGDDGAGPELIRLIGGRVSAECFDVGVAPENYLEKIVSVAPDTVLIVDAADFDGAPGEAMIFSAEDAKSGGLSTHALSLDMVCTYLSVRRPMTVWVLGIQPAAVGLCAGLSAEVAATVGEIADCLAAMLPK